MGEDKTPTPAADEQPTAVAPSDLGAASDDDRRIGPYRLLQLLGEGGMGEVWEASQSEPVRRRVALKLIKPGMDSKQVLARFEAERQALAMMNHPGIAQVFDAGTTPKGRPYFVMELVKGVPITEYCDGQRLETRSRLDLMMAVCGAVQHAHQKGVIHRDLKPSNILVTVQDDRAVPKIIDFGVAKAIDQRLTDSTVFTQLGQWVGTPEYMSPEQAEMSGLDIDTRADVYSLGAVLYELLAGAQIFDPTELRKAGFDEMRRRIREEHPALPSTRLTTLGGTSSEIADRRNTRPSQLMKHLRGDLDWIVMKALEKDRTRRYGSPAELARDIERHLANEPVEAGPPSTTYRLAKFVRRHRFGVAAGVALAILLMAAVVGTSVGLVRARRAETAATLEAETARQVSDFLVASFRVVDPEEALGETVTAREVLEQGARRIETELRGQPQVRARLMATMGEVFSNLGLYEDAEPLLQQSLALRQELPASQSEVADSQVRLARLWISLGRSEKARELLEPALETRTRLQGSTHPGAAEIEILLGGIESDSTVAMQRILRGLEAYEGGVDEVGRAAGLVILSGDQIELGRSEEAIESVEEALRIYRLELGEDHPDTQTALNLVATLHADLGDRAEAAAALERSIESTMRVLGPDHPRLAGKKTNLAIVYGRLGRLEEARRLFEDTLRIYREKLGDAAVTLSAAANLAWIQGLQGEVDSAEGGFRVAAEGLTRLDATIELRTVLVDWAELLRRNGREAEAVELERRVAALDER